MKGHRLAPINADNRHAPAPFETAPYHGHKRQFLEFLQWMSASRWERPAFPTTESLNSAFGRRLQRQRCAICRISVAAISSLLWAQTGPISTQHCSIAFKF